MEATGQFELFLLLLAVTVGLEFIARRARMPPAAALTIGGILLALLPGMPEVAIDPDLVLVLFLPPLLLSSAYATVWRDFRADLAPILSLAIGAVAFTTLVVGVVAHWAVPSLPWAACFALGAIVSPPDAVAAKAVLAGLPLPPRVTTLLEGESLVNDASGLVLYRFAVIAALTGFFSLGGAVLGFLFVSIGGLAIGLALGFTAIWLMRWVRAPDLAVLISFLMTWVTYIVADRLQVSGVLACVAAGLVVGWRQHRALPAAMRVQAGIIWEITVFILESTVFILIGLSLRPILTRLGGWDATVALLPATAAVVGAVVIGRFVWLYFGIYGLREVGRRIGVAPPKPPWQVPIVLGWAGMRGVVSLAAALALPDRFPGRDVILAITFAVILVTVLVQGTTLASLIRILRLPELPVVTRPTMSEIEARAEVASAQLAAVARLSRQSDGTEQHPRLLEQYGFRADLLRQISASGPPDPKGRQLHYSTVLAATDAGRAELLRLFRARRIHQSVLIRLEEELDAEELSSRRYIDD